MSVYSHCSPHSSSIHFWCELYVLVVGFLGLFPSGAALYMIAAQDHKSFVASHTVTVLSCLMIVLSLFHMFLLCLFFPMCLWWDNRGSLGILLPSSECVSVIVLVGWLVFLGVDLAYYLVV